MFQRGLYLWFYADGHSNNCLFYRVTVDGAIPYKAPDTEALESFNEEMHGGQFDYEVMAKLSWLNTERDCVELITKWVDQQDPQCHPEFPKLYIPNEILDIPSHILNAPGSDGLEELIDSWNVSLGRTVWCDLPPQAHIVPT